MHLKANAIEIPDNDPFKNDALGRAKCADVLTNLVLNSSRPTVLAINSGWGTGKTTFLEMWSSSLRTKGVPVIAFNAWKNDYSSDTLTSLVGEVDHFIRGRLVPQESRDPALEVLIKVRKAVGKILVASIPTGLRIATSGFLNLDEKTVAAVSEGIEKIADKKIEEYQAGKDAVVDLRNSLTELAGALPNVPNAVGGVKLVIIVDELDRCRPTFAIDVLEKIKHFFGVPGIMFVVAVDREQLAHSIKTVYGHEMDTDGYLRRFFDFEFRFPKSESDGFYSAMVSRFGIDEYVRLRKDAVSQTFTELFLQIFKPLAQAFDLSLRRQEQCFGLFSLTLLTTPRNQRLLPHMLAIMIFLKVENPDFYLGYNAGSVNTEQIMEWLRKSTVLTAKVTQQWFYSVEAYLLEATPHKEKYAAFYQKMISFNGGPSHPEQDHLSKVQAALRNMPSDIQGCWKPLFEKLEFELSILTSTQISDGN